MKEHIHVDNIKKKVLSLIYHCVFIIYNKYIASAKCTCLVDCSGQLFQKRQKVSEYICI